MSNRMWGGRFSAGPDAIMEEINASIGFDKRLYRQDIAASIAHANMLAKTGIISPEDKEAIITGLAQLENEIERGEFDFSRALEDIHMNIEAKLRENIGDAAARLHTARSRNDQVATDFRLYVRDVIDLLLGQIKDLQLALVARAEQEAQTVMPGFTHMQSAQPVTLGHHLLAYVEMLSRDYHRFVDARKRVNVCPLGAAALAGTSFPIDREMSAKELGFSHPATNSLDAVSDRDFVIETLGAASICAMHLSRFAEELVIWSTPQFGFVQLSDRFSTGSSIMPQKRNPDAAELIRAKIGRIFAAQVALTIVMKGLPMTYAKDMQEDKEGAFDAFDSLSLSLAAMSGMVADMKFNRDKMRAAAASGFSTATDLADWLVRTLDMPFRNAHHVTGEIVALAEAKNCALEELSLKDMQNIEPGITGQIFEVLSVENSVASRTSLGGTAPANVKRQIARWQQALTENPIK
ncbi:Argininosuccinate lyase [hydrothermal vent metagenome]|uniref:Argininosuccinate lyase n=1 Tax=hydrothermal vent metagenome TaxID=652676 RepID=A0A3B0TV43_9ZZZZ